MRKVYIAGDSMCVEGFSGSTNDDERIEYHRQVILHKAGDRRWVECSRCGTILDIVDDERG